MGSLDLPGNAGASLAVRDGTIYVARRQAREITVGDLAGKVKRRFSVPMPPNAIAVDDLGSVYVFGVFADADAGPYLLDVYDSSGTRVRRVGTVPGYRKDGTLEQRNDLFPLLRTDSSGGVWALLRDGKTILRVGATEGGEDLLDISSPGGVPLPPPDAEAEKAARAERENVRKKLVAHLQKQGVDPSDPRAHIFVPKNSPWRYRDFACRHRECVLLPANALGDGVKVTVTRVDLDKHVEALEFSLERRPEELLAVGVVKERFVLYGILDGQLVEFELPG